MAEEGLDHVMDGKEDQSIFQVVPKITFFQPTWTLYKCKGDIPPLSIVRKEAPSFIIQVVTDLMEEREQLRFTILSSSLLSFYSPYSFSPVLLLLGSTSRRRE